MAEYVSELKRSASAFVGKINNLREVGVSVKRAVAREKWTSWIRSNGRDPFIDFTGKRKKLRGYVAEEFVRSGKLTFNVCLFSNGFPYDSVLFIGAHFITFFLSLFRDRPLPVTLSSALKARSNFGMSACLSSSRASSTAFLVLGLDDTLPF